MRFRTGRLKDVIKTVATAIWLSFLQTTDIYDPDRVEADRDLLRRFYLKHGYADVRIVSALGEYDPAKKGFIVTFTIDEGPQYHVGTVDVISNVQDDRSRHDAQYRQAQSRRRVQCRPGAKERRGDDDRGRQARLCFRQRAAARRPRFRDQDHQSLLSWSRRERAPISSASTFAAIPARATTSSAANSISARATPIIVRWSIAPSGG